MALIDEVPVDGRIGEVLAWSGEDPDRCQVALDAENDASARPSLIAALEKFITEGGHEVLRENRPKRTPRAEAPEKIPAPVFEAIVERTLTGQPKRRVRSDSQQAASHWDDRFWKRGP